MLWTDLRILVVDTGRVWWRLLPQILGLYLLGWLLSQLTLRVAVIAGDVSPWLTLALFAFNFVFLLGSTVLILRLAERELGIRSLIPAEEAEDDDRDSSFTHLLAVTLLPFLGMYAAFGQVSLAAQRLLTEQTVRYGGISDQPTVNGVLFDLAVGSSVPGAGADRRDLSRPPGVDYVHHRTGWRVLGLVVALIESFFLLVLILGGIRIFQVVRLWLRDRAVTGWLAAYRTAWPGSSPCSRSTCPRCISRLVAFFNEQVWPIFVEVVSQPIIWLAVAALVFGSRVLSLAELWRKGQPYARRAPGASTFASYRQKQAVRRLGPPPQGIRLAGTQVKEAFFGDIDDKYLPTFHSLRLVLRAGLVFLGSYVLVYSMIAIAQNYAGTLLYAAIGVTRSTSG